MPSRSCGFGRSTQFRNPLRLSQPAALARDGVSFAVAFFGFKAEGLSVYLAQPDGPDGLG